MIRTIASITFILLLSAGAVFAFDQAAAPDAGASCADVSKAATPLVEAGDAASLEKAKEIFANAISKNSDCVPALVGYARVLNEQDGFKIGVENYFTAFEYLARALVIEPDNVEALWVMADLQRHTSNFKRGYPLAQKAVELAPDDPYANYVLGSILLNMSMGQAITYLEKALQSKPEWYDVRLNLGAAYLSVKNYPKALENFSEYIGKNKNNVKAFSNRGMTYFTMGKIAEAEADYDAALKLDPRFAPALKGRGDVYRAKKDYGKAIDSYKLALVSLPNDVPVWTALAQTQKEAGLNSQALITYGKILELDNNNAEAQKMIMELKAACGPTPSDNPSEIKSCPQR